MIMKKKPIDVEIERLHNELAQLTPSTEEYTAVEDNLIKLINFKEARTSRVSKDFINGGEIVLKTGMILFGTVAAYCFEKEGSFTSSFGRKFNDMLLSWKK